MPEEENKKTVDIDTSGPGQEVELPEEKHEEDKTYENERETKLEDGGSATDSSQKSDQQSDVRMEENKTEQKTSEEGSDKQQDNTKAVEEYSEGVKKRIAKLTKKMREAERQREEAIAFANRVKRERDQFEAKSTSLDKNYATEMEGRISSSLAAAQEKLKTARLNEDAKAEVKL